MSFNLTTSGAIIHKAGSGADSAATTSGALIAELCDLSEATLCALTRKDWVTDYSGINANFKAVLSDAVSDLAAMKLICWSMNGYTSRYEAQTMLDVLRDNFMRNLDVLKDDKHKEVME